MIGHRVVLRPRSILETGDLAAAFIRRHALLFAKLLPWTVVPALAVVALQHFLSLEMPWTLLLLAPVTSLGAGVYVVLCGDLMLRETTDLRSVQRRFLRGLAAFVLSRLVAWFLVGISIAFAYANAAFVPECSLLERGTTGASLSRSGALMRAVPGRAIGFAIVQWVIVLLAAAGGELARYYLRDLFGLSNTQIDIFNGALGWAACLGVALVAPYLEVLRFLLYIDARTRREGWDLQVQMNALVTVAENGGARRAAAEAA